MSEWAVAPGAHLCSTPALRTPNGTSPSLSGGRGGSPGHRPLAPGGPETPHPHPDDRGATPSRRVLRQQLPEVTSRVPQRGSPARRGVFRGPDAPSQPSACAAGPPHSLCHSVTENIPQAAWGPPAAGWPGGAAARTQRAQLGGADPWQGVQGASGESLTAPAPRPAPHQRLPEAKAPPSPQKARPHPQGPREAPPPPRPRPVPRGRAHGPLPFHGTWTA